MKDHLIAHVNSKVIFFTVVIVFEFIIGVCSSINPKYSTLLVGALISIIAVVTVLEPRVTLYLIFFMIPLSLFGVKAGVAVNVRLVHILVPSLFFALIIRIVVQGTIDFQRSPLDILLLMFLLLAAISIAWTPEKINSLVPLIKSIFAVLFYFLILNLVRSRDDLYKCLWAFFIAMLILIGVQFVQVLGLQSIGSYMELGYFERFGSFSDSPSTLAFDLLSGFWLALALAVLEKGRVKRNLIYFSIPFMIIALYFTGIRACYVAFIVSLLIYLLSEVRIRRLLFYEIVACLMIALFATIFFSQNDIVWFFRSAFNPKDLSMMFRYIVWETSYDMIRDNLYFGVGMGGFASLFSRYNTTPLTTESIFEGSLPRTHSLYLDFLTELGIIGFFIFLVIVGLALKKLILTFYQVKGTPNAKLIKFMIMLLISLLIHGLVGSEKNEYTLWMMFGLAMAACSVAKNPYQEDSETKVISASYSA